MATIERDPVTGMQAVTRPLSIPELAARWGKHEVTIRRNIAAGKLPVPILLCGRPAFTPAQIHAVERGEFQPEHTLPSIQRTRAR